MTDENEIITTREYSKILEAVVASIKSKGFKATRMDDIATTLAMSKRTLYEIFDNKDDMIIKAISYLRNDQEKRISEFFRTSDNVLEAVLKSILFRQQFIRESSPILYNELNSSADKFKQHLQPLTPKELEKGVMLMFQQGIQQGVFKTNKDYKQSLRILYIQLESVKRCEDMIPDSIKPWQIYNNISINFLRSIVTPAGLEILEHYISTYDLENEENHKETLNK